MNKEEHTKDASKLNHVSQAQGIKGHQQLEYPIIMSKMGDGEG